MANPITPERLSDALQSGGEFLASAVVSEGASRGFPEIAGGRRIRPWGGTADGLLGLHYVGQLSSPDLKGLTNWLYDNQDRDTGGWESRGVPLVEATAAVLVALLTVGAPRPEPLRSAVDFLLRHQTGGGGFAPAANASPRVFTTCLSAWALSLTRTTPLHTAKEQMIETCLEEARNWLVDARTDQGAWGLLSKAEEVPSPAHTGLVLHVLGLLDNTPSGVREQALIWLRSAVAEMTALRVELHRVGANESEIRTFHLNHAWALIGLTSQGVSAFDSDAQALATVLLGNQDPSSGAFLCAPSDADHPLPYVWASVRSLHALAALRQQLVSEASAIDVAERLIGLESEVVAVRAQLRRQQRGSRLIALVLGALLLLSILLFWNTHTEEVFGDVGRTIGSFLAETWRRQRLYGLVFAILCIPLTALATWLFLRFVRRVGAAVKSYFDIEI